MIKIYVSKNKKAAFCVMLNKRDARKFLNKCKGERDYFGVGGEFDFQMDCTFPENYSLEVFNGKDTYKKTIELMDGDLNGGTR